MASRKGELTPVDRFDPYRTDRTDGTTVPRPSTALSSRYRFHIRPRNTPIMECGRDERSITAGLRQGLEIVSASDTPTGDYLRRRGQVPQLAANRFCPHALTDANSR